MTLNSSWSHIKKFLPLIHTFPFKWSSASIIFLIFIRCENLPSLNHGLFLLFVLIFLYLLTLNKSFDHYSTISFYLSDYYIVIISCDTIQYQRDPWKYLTIPFVLKNYPVWLLKYFNAVLLLPKTFNISLNVSSALYIFSFCTVWTDNE